MEYQQGGTGPLEMVLAVVAGLFAIVVAWKSFGYVAADLRRRRENQPPDHDPDSRA
jgi:hypothetical protein